MQGRPGLSASDSLILVEEKYFAYGEFVQTAHAIIIVIAFLKLWIFWVYYCKLLSCLQDHDALIWNYFLLFSLNISNLLLYNSHFLLYMISFMTVVITITTVVIAHLWVGTLVVLNLFHFVLFWLIALHFNPFHMNKFPSSIELATLESLVNIRCHFYEKDL